MGLPKTPSFRLDNKRALVAGGTSGIGLGCAAALAQAGAAVTIMARNTDRLAETKIAFEAEGHSVNTLQIDITDTPKLEAKIAQQAPFDILVNSAGFARQKPAFDTTEDDYDTVTDINVRAAYFLTRAVAKGLIDAGRPGSLINISSQMAHVGGQDRTVYAATKHAIEGMTKSMAIEWAPHQVRVNTICPTFIRTPLAEQTLSVPERRKWIEDKIKLGRVGEIEDIMGAVTYLASDASALMTGTSILIDGGWTAG